MPTFGEPNLHANELNRMLFEKSGPERRTSLIMLQYWNQLRGERDFPDESELDPEALGEIWGHAFVIQLRDVRQVKDYNFTYLGPKLMQAYRDEVLDSNNRVMISPHANQLAHLFEEVFTTRDPLIDEGEYINQHGERILFRQIFLPLGSEGSIFSILGGAWFKISLS